MNALDAAVADLSVAIVLTNWDSPSVESGYAVQSSADIVEAEVAALMEDLGIPGRASIAIRHSSENEQAVPAMSIRVEAEDCYVADEVVTAARAYIAGRLPQLAMQPVSRTSELAEGTPDGKGIAEDRASHAPRDEDEDPAELLRLICRAALSAQPSALLTPAQIERYFDRDPLPDSLTTERVCNVLKGVLKLGVSIADRDKVYGVLTDATRGDVGDEQRLEDLVDALIPDVVQVHMHPDLLRQVTTDYAEVSADTIAIMREGIFAELGLALPKLGFRPEPSMRPGGFAFGVNHIRTQPMIALPSGVILVNESADQLALMGIDATPALNPATSQPASVVGDQHKEVLESAGLATWDQLGHIVLSLADTIRHRGYELMNRRLADDMLAQVGSILPDLERQARAHITDVELSQVLRSLLVDRISIRNLPRILDLMLEYRTAHDRDHPEDVLTFIRTGLAEQIAVMTARGTDTTVIYLLAPEVEDGVADDQEGVAERLTAALREELESLPPTALRPVILTQDHVRGRIRDIVRREFPRVGVIAYSDLPPQHNVQPIARISWV